MKQKLIRFKILAFKDVTTIETKIIMETSILIGKWILTEDELVGYFAEKYDLIEERVRGIIRGMKLKQMPGEDGEYVCPNSVTFHKWTGIVASREDSYRWYRDTVELSGPFEKARGIINTARVMSGQNPAQMDIFNWMLAQSPLPMISDEELIPMIPGELLQGMQEEAAGRELTHDELFEAVMRSRTLEQIILGNRSVEEILAQFPPLNPTRVITGGRIYDLFYSNDYLGLRVHPRVVAESMKALLMHGNGTGGSAMLSGSVPPRVDAERVITSFKGVPATVVFNSGADANNAMATSYFDSDSIFFSDRLNHATIIDGMRQSHARVVSFKHNDVGDLERVVERTIKEHGNRALRNAMLFVESVYSMDGDIARLNEMLPIAKKYGLVVGIDEAHATLVLGRTGRGICEHQSIKPSEIDLLMGTLSKAVGANGGFISAKPRRVLGFKLLSRRYWFSTAQNAASFAGAAESFRIVQENPDLVDELREKAARVRKALKRMGYNIGYSETHIIPVIIGDQLRAAMLSDQLKKRGILAAAIFAPAVPSGQERIRLSISAKHTEEQINRLLDVFESARTMMGLK